MSVLPIWSGTERQEMGGVVKLRFNFKGGDRKGASPKEETDV